jgi:hypothetical protein
VIASLLPVLAISFDIARGVAQDQAMARNLTSLLFADGLWRVVWEESDGKQYVIVRLGVL